MSFNLKTLKETGNKVKEFSFLSKVTDYINDNYAEIKELLDSDNYKEILKELGNEFVNIKNYDELEYISIGTYNTSLYIGLHNDELEKTKDHFHIYNAGSIFNDIDLYYISDEIAHARYLNELETADRQKEIDAEQKHLEEETIRKEEDLKLIAKYSLSVDDIDKIDNIRIFEKIFLSEDLKERFTAFTEVFNNDNITKDDVRKIAKVYVQDAIADHEYEYH